MSIQVSKSKDQIKAEIYDELARMIEDAYNAGLCYPEQALTDLLREASERCAKRALLEGGQ